MSVDLQSLAIEIKGMHPDDRKRILKYGVSDDGIVMLARTYRISVDNMRKVYVACVEQAKPSELPEGPPPDVWHGEPKNSAPTGKPDGLDLLLHETVSHLTETIQSLEVLREGFDHRLSMVEVVQVTGMSEEQAEKFLLEYAVIPLPKVTVQFIDKSKTS